MSTDILAMFPKNILAIVSEKTQEHIDDIETMSENFSITDHGEYIETHVLAFAELGRDPDYASISGGQNPDDTNCRAYPKPNGAWYVCLYHRKADQEKPGWHDNTKGWASRWYPGHRPTINVLDPEHEQQSQAIAALAHRPTVFQRNKKLVRLENDSPKPQHALRETQPPMIAPLPLSELAVELDRAAEFVRPAKKKATITAVPMRLVQAVAGAANYGNVPTLEGVIRTPRFLVTGDVLCTRGFDLRTGLYYCPEPSLKFGELMSVEDAIATIDDVLSDFPFAAIEHKSVIFSGILSVLARTAYHGPCPLHLIEGNAPGVGKGLTVDVIAEISYGQALPRIAANGRDDDELRKTITALVIQGNAAVMFDNLTGYIDSAALSALLTSTTWQGRWLGKSETITMPWQGVVFATGNNLSMSTDLCRRTLYARLNSPLERPDERTDLKYPRLLNHVRDERSELVTAALSILRQWHLAGRPKQNLPAMGSYEAWSDVVRSAIVWAGLPDPVSSREELREANSDIEILSLLLDGWHEADPERKGMTAAQAVELAYGKQQYPSLRAVVEALPTGDAKLQLGYALRKYCGVVRNQQTFEKIRGRTTLWKVRAA